MDQEFKYGDKVEVRDDKRYDWAPAIYFCNDIDEDVEYRYIARLLNGRIATGFRYCRHRRPDFKLNDPVIVSGCKKRHFAGWGVDGGILVYSGGRTSFTAQHRHDFTWWRKYRKPTEEELSNRRWGGK